MEISYVGGYLGMRPMLVCNTLTPNIDLEGMPMCMTLRN